MVVYFPANTADDEIIYYTTPLGQSGELKRENGTSNAIIIAANSLIAASSTVFDNMTYTWDLSDPRITHINNTCVRINSINGFGNGVEFGYADNAPVWKERTNKLWIIMII